MKILFLENAKCGVSKMRNEEERSELVLKKCNKLNLLIPNLTSQISNHTSTDHCLLITVLLKFILPHHALNRFYTALVILRIFLGVVHRFNVTFHHEIDQLPDRHACIYADRLRA